MSYLTTALVQAEFKSLDLASSTAVTSSKVDEFIDQEEAVLNGLIGQVYSVPIAADAAVSIAIVKAIATYMVKARVEDLLAVKTGSKLPDQGSDEPHPLYKKAMDLIDKIRKREMTLPDAELANPTGGVQSYTSANGLEHAFKRCKEQW